MNRNISIASLILLSAVLLSVPFLVPGTGFLSLIALVPLLRAEQYATSSEMKRFCLWHYACFVLWNAATTFWVCNATVGGGIFAVLANALQMSLVFGLFRWSKKHLRGSLPYIFLAFAWIAWEHWYLHWSQISWPWLILGNSFARTTNWVQWYELTGTLGGSLWIWAANLSVFGVLTAIRTGSWKVWNSKAKGAAIAGILTLFLAPLAVSLSLKPDPPTGALDVVIAQPNIDPYNKFGGMSQNEQNNLLISQFSCTPSDSAVLLIAPETFTNDIITNDISNSPTVKQFSKFLSERPMANLLFGASSWEKVESASRPSETARQMGEGLWVESHNSALMMKPGGECGIYQKSKLVVGVEMTPYPGFFRPIDDKLGGVMGRCVGQKEVSNLSFCEYDSTGTETVNVPVGCAVCYESVYGEHCAEYVRKGARLLTVITNDAWWKDTPGYRQHLSYASLRAIETRRWVARCANTGISAIIDPRGRIVKQTSWWIPETLKGKTGLSDQCTFYVKNGDYIGRISVMMFVLILLGAIVRRFTT